MWKRKLTWGENVRITSYYEESLGRDAVVGKQLEGVRPELGADLQRFRLGRRGRLEGKTTLRIQRLHRTLSKYRSGMGNPLF